MTATGYPMRPLLAIAAVTLLATTGCRPAPAAVPSIVALTITVVPTGGGSAGFEVSRDGTMKGWHLSGDSVPFVHQAEGRLDSAAVDSLWALASILDSASANATPPAGRGYAALQLTFANGTPWVTSWPDTAESTDPRLRATARWLLAHRIGGW
jgi:hypothetical protein